MPNSEEDVGKEEKGGQKKGDTDFILGHLCLALVLFPLLVGPVEVKRWS